MKNVKGKREHFENYPEALDTLARTLRAREFDPDKYYIVLTPDRYTQTVENALFSNGGALDTEVLTLSRLARRIAPNDKTLGKEGGVMLVARAAEKVKPSLTYYAHAASYYDFARSVFDTILQFRASGVDLSAVEPSGKSATDAKLNDLKLIYDEYKILKAEYADSSDRLVQLAANIESSELIKKSHVFAIGYEFGYDTTALNRAVFDAIKRSARSFTEYKVAPNDRPLKSMTVFSAPDRAAQYKEIAVRIKDHLYRGGDPDGVYIICPEPRALSRILGEYGIDFYHDESTPLECTPPFVAIDCIYKLKPAVVGDKAADAKTLVALCKNPFSGVDELDAQSLMLVAAGRRFIRLDDKRFDDGALRAAKRVKELVGWFKGDFRDAVKNVMANAEFDKLYEKLYGNNTDGITPITELSELVWRCGSGEFDSDAKAFFSAARAVEIKSLPRYRHRVTVTVPQTLRMTRCEKLFVVDFNEGVLPAATSDSGLIADDELYYINSGTCKNKPVEPTVREQNRRERRELLSVVQNAEDVFCSYVTAGRMKLSAFASELAEKLDVRSYAEVSSVLKFSDDAEFISSYACTPAAAREIVARNASKHAVSIDGAAGTGTRAAEFEPTVKTVVRRSVSVSELSHWFSCPYKRFLRDVVGVGERRNDTLDAVDFGIVVHEFMEKFLESEPYDTTVEHIKSIIDDIIAEKNLDPDEHARARLVADAEQFAKVNIHVLECGKYGIFGREHEFEGRTLGNKHKVEFKGKIDRIDTYGEYFRIMDYKTGATEFKVKKCIIGTDMQLPLYAYAMGADKATGFFYVKLGSKFGNSRPLHGEFIREIDTVCGYDDKIGGFLPSDVISIKLKLDKKTGDVSFNGTYKGGMPRETFAALIDYCVANASLAVDEMNDGFIDRTPIEGGCSYCAYGGICGDRIVSRTDRVSASFIEEADDDD